MELMLDLGANRRTYLLGTQHGMGFASFACFLLADALLHRLQDACGVTVEGDDVEFEGLTRASRCVGSEEGVSTTGVLTALRKLSASSD